MRKFNIHPSCVLDGKAPPEKKKEQEKRRARTDYIENQFIKLDMAIEEYKTTGKSTQILIDEMKKSKDNVVSLLIPESTHIDIVFLEERRNKLSNQVVSFTREDIKDMKLLAVYLGIPLIQSPGEAETYACQVDDFDYVLSADSDVLAHGKDLIRKIDLKQNMATLVRIVDVLEVMNMTQTQFLDFCIMCKCDYNTNIPRVGPVGARKLLEQYGTIEAIEGKDISMLNHIQCRKLFTLPHINLGLTWCPKLNIEDTFKRLQSLGCLFSEQQLKKYLKMPKIYFYDHIKDIENIIENPSEYSSSSIDNIEILLN